MKILRQSLKNLLYRIALQLALTAFSIRSRRMIERQATELGLVDLARRIGSQVLSGPFRGMQLDVGAFPQHVSPKLCGSYEDELHEALEHVIERKPKLVVNVGCAEGYYAVGLAKRLPEARVIAFDADPRARSATRRNALLNNVRVEVRGILQAGPMQHLLSEAAPNVLLIMDIEGAEYELLDPNLAPSLRDADIIVELHPHIIANIEQELEWRFSMSHSIERFVPKLISEKRSRSPAWLSNEDKLRAVDERRSETPWLLLLPF